MADAKVTALAEVTAPVNTDIVPMVSDPGGSPVSKKIKLFNLLRGLFVLVFTLVADASTGANVTPISLTGLVFTFEANAVYYIRVIGSVSAAAATTGCGFQLDVSVAVTDIALTFFHQLANTGTLSGGNSIADDASAGVSSGIPTTGTNIPVAGFGILRTGASTGTAQLRFRSETTAVITAKAGMTMIVEKVG